MSDHRNTGKWSDEEIALFQQGIAEFGLDWRKMEEFMGGARNLNQIRHFYRTTKEKDPGMFSPEKIGTKTPKKRSSDAAGNKLTTTPKKKTKAGADESKTPANRTPKRAPASAAKAGVSAKTRGTPKPSTSVEHSEEEEEFDEIPPPLPTTAGKKAAPKKAAPAASAAKKSLSSGSEAAAAAEEVVEKSTPIKAITDFLKKEEVQTVLAGILGFVVVFVAKKLMK